MNKWLVLLVLSGCTMGPDYETPEVCVPVQYKEALCHRDPMDLATWWHQFNDCLLDELIEKALLCNYDLQIALHTIEEVRALYKIDRSELYPQIQGNIVALRDRRSENISSGLIEAGNTPADVFAADFGGPLIQNFFQFGFDASWELDFFGKNRRKSEAAYRDFEASQENALDVQITLISDVARSYVDIRSLQQQIQAKQDQICRQCELRELAEARYCAGLSSYLEVTRAQAAYDAIEATLPPLQEELQVTIHGLATLLGLPPEQFCIEEGDMPLAAGLIPEELPADLLCRRPDIRLAERELAAATARIGVAIAELFPTFSLTSTFGTQADHFSKAFIWPSRFWSIGPNMVWNLFTGGRLLAQIEVTNERQKQAILAYERAINDALRDVEDRLVGYYKEGERLSSLEQQLCSTSLQRDLSQDQYLAGLISFDDVLDAESNLYETQISMIESQGTQMLQLIRLYKALGGGWQCCD